MNDGIFSFKTLSDVDTERLGAMLARSLEGASIKSAFIALRGEMGVGKTAFTRGFGGYFGIKNVKSPTYSLLNEYRAKANIYHFDMYRIESEDDLISIGYDDYLEKGGYILCEWSENIEEFLPSDVIFVTVSRVADNENAREITVNFRGKKFENFNLGALT